MKYYFTHDYFAPLIVTKIYIVMPNPCILGLQQT